MVTPDYFRTFGMRMERGRAFTEDDRAGRPRVAIVNEAFVKRFLPGVDPLTQRLVIEELIPGGRASARPSSGRSWASTAASATPVRAGTMEEIDVRSCRVPGRRPPSRCARRWTRRAFAGLAAIVTRWTPTCRWRT